MFLTVVDKLSRSLTLAREWPDIRMPASRGQCHGRLHQPGRQPTDRRTIFSNRKNPRRYHPRIGSSPPRQTLEFAVEASEKETAESIERSVDHAPHVLDGVWSLLRAEP